MILSKTFDINVLTILFIAALSKTEIIAQGFVLFLAGFDTTANGISFLLYCLALHPECQKKAQEEIDRVVGNKVRILRWDFTHSVYPLSERE